MIWRTASRRGQFSRRLNAVATRRRYFPPRRGRVEFAASLRGGSYLWLHTWNNTPLHHTSPFFSICSCTYCTAIWRYWVFTCTCSCLISNATTRRTRAVTRPRAPIAMDHNYTKFVNPFRNHSIFMWKNPGKLEKISVELPNDPVPDSALHDVLSRYTEYFYLLRTHGLLKDTAGFVASKTSTVGQFFWRHWVKEQWILHCFYIWRHKKVAYREATNLAVSLRRPCMGMRGLYGKIVVGGLQSGTGR